MTGILTTDPIVARNFYMDIKDIGQIVLSGVSGLEIEMEVVSLQQNGLKGKQQHIKTVGGILKAPDLTINRMAPPHADQDPMWQWFRKIRDLGMQHKKRNDQRHDGSIFMIDSYGDKIGQFDFFNAWPSKIATDQLSTDSNDPMKETITLVVERIERVS